VFGGSIEVVGPVGRRVRTGGRWLRLIARNVRNRPSDSDVARRKKKKTNHTDVNGELN